MSFPPLYAMASDLQVLWHWPLDTGGPGAGPYPRLADGGAMRSGVHQDDQW